MSEHLPAETVAGYVDRTLSREQRRSAELHLAACATCRDEVVDVTHLTRAPRAAYRAPLAAAASIALLMVGGLLMTGRDAELVRAAEEHGAIRVVAPAEGAAVGARAHLVWRHVPQAVQYRITVMDDDGDVVSEKLVAGSTVEVASLPPAASLRWYITAIMEDGTAVSSPIMSFRTR